MSQAFNVKCNVTSEINHMNEGIRLGLTEDREKHSESLGRTAQWSGTAALSALPAYLTVQIMRFYYKVAAQQRAKIMRRVLLPPFLLMKSENTTRNSLYGNGYTGLHYIILFCMIYICVSLALV